VSIFCQYNPLSASKAGGIGSLIRSFISNAPSDFEFRVIGVADDMEAYSLHCWHKISIAGKEVLFFPTLYDGESSLLPLGVRFAYSLYAVLRDLKIEDSVLHFHRPEPVLPFLMHSNLKVLFIHNSVGVDIEGQSAKQRAKNRILRVVNSSIEDISIPKVQRVYAVREAFAVDYRARYPGNADCVTAIPTWTDTTTFYPLLDDDRSRQRKALVQGLRWQDSDLILSFVGRLEEQKDPHLLLEILLKLRKCNIPARLLIIGNGSMLNEMKKRVAGNSFLDGSIEFYGNQPPEKIAGLLAMSDLFVLPSRYEGLPVALLEALACGVPAVAANVGDVYRVLQRGGGTLVNGREPEIFADEIVKLWKNKPQLHNCLESVRPFTANEVLSSMYQEHYRLANRQKI